MNQNAAGNSKCSGNSIKISVFQFASWKLTWIICTHPLNYLIEGQIVTVCVYKDSLVTLSSPASLFDW
jgi:hypothetical protein